MTYLDLINQDQILALLKQVRPTMLILEHDPALIAQLGAPTLPLNN
ncbi:ABC transporter ATPase [Limosilactobacillus ingluviei]|nr:ABC transporter ATPase [Limosilactobacillus ingluviei]